MDSVGQKVLNGKKA